MEEPILRQLERDWHNDVILMIRDRLPKALIVFLILFLLQRISLFFVRRVKRLAAHQTANPTRASQLRTIATLIRGTSLSILGFLAFLQLLNLLNFNYGPLLASAGIVGIGIGLGAQSIFKDILNGILIFVEDQYNVGETVRLAALTGTVEDLTLRLTRLRDGDGTLYIIPNSQIAVVSNLSRDYSVATLPVAVDASANPDNVIAVLTDICAQVSAEPAFTGLFVESPSVLGVDKIDGRSVFYPINFRVRPNQKDVVLRDFRRRIILTFEQKGISLGSDSSLLIMQPPKDPTTTPESKQ